MCVFTSCLGGREQKQEINRDLKKAQIKKINIDYQESKSFYEDNFVNHFPLSLDENYVTYTESVTPEAGLIRLDLVTRLGKCDIEKIARSAIAKYKSSDTCLLVVNRFASMENYSFNIQLTEKDKRIIDLECYNELYPIPNFWNSDYTIKDSGCKLEEGFDIFIIEAKSGKYLKDELLTDGRYMPKKWKNGFSKGIAFSERRGVIIYWTLIW